MHHSSNNEIIYCDLPRLLSGSMIKSSLKKFPKPPATWRNSKHPIYHPIPTHTTPYSIIFSRLYLPTLNSLGIKVQTPICQNVNIHVAMLNHNIHNPWVSLGCQTRKLKYQEQCWNREKTDKAVKKMKHQILKVSGDQYCCSLHRSKM